MANQDRNKDTAQPQRRPLGRRAFIDTTLRVAAGIAATPLLIAAEPLLRPFVDGGGSVEAQEGPKKAELPKRPTWVRPAEEFRSDWIATDVKFREVLQIALGTEEPDLVNAVNFLLERNGAGTEQKIADFQLKFAIQLHTQPVPGKAPFSVNWGPDEAITDQMDVSLMVANKFADNPQFQADSLDTATSLYTAIEVLRLCEALVKTQTNVADANSILVNNQNNIGREGAKIGAAFAKRVIEGKLYETWGLKAPAEVALAEPENP